MAEASRERKVRVTLWSNWLLSGGLVACLLAAIYMKDIGLVITGLYVPFAAGIGTNLALFVNGNVKVHQAQGEK
jgi:hypothetical protein